MGIKDDLKQSFHYRKKNILLFSSKLSDRFPQTQHQGYLVREKKYDYKFVP